MKTFQVPQKFLTCKKFRRQYDFFFFFDPSIFSHNKNYLFSCEILKYDRKVYLPEQSRKILSSQGGKVSAFLFCVPALTFLPFQGLFTTHLKCTQQQHYCFSELPCQPRLINLFSLQDVLLLLLLKLLIWYLISYCIYFFKLILLFTVYFLISPAVVIQFVILSMYICLPGSLPTQGLSRGNSKL